MEEEDQLLTDVPPSAGEGIYLYLGACHWELQTGFSGSIQATTGHGPDLHTLWTTSDYLQKSFLPVIQIVTSQINKEVSGIKLT